MTSNMNKLFGQLNSNFLGPSEKSINKSNFSFENIFKTDNFEKEQDEQLEGNFLFSMLGGKRYFAFDNSTIRNAQ